MSDTEKSFSFSNTVETYEPHVLADSRGVIVQIFWLGQSLQHGWRGVHQVRVKVGPAGAME